MCTILGSYIYDKGSDIQISFPFHGLQCRYEVIHLQPCGLKEYHKDERKNITEYLCSNCRAQSHIMKTSLFIGDKH